MTWTLQEVDQKHFMCGVFGVMPDGACSTNRDIKSFLLKIIFIGRLQVLYFSINNAQRVSNTRFMVTKLFPFYAVCGSNVFKCREFY